MDVVNARRGCRSFWRIALVLVGCSPGAVLARGGWEDPPGGWDYVYEANAGQGLYVPGDSTVGLLDGTWAQHQERSLWDGTPPGVANTTNTDPTSGNLLPPAPGGVKVVCPEGETGEDGNPLCYLLIEDVGDPTSAAVFTPPYMEPSKRKLYFYHATSGNSEDGWTLVARLRLSDTAIDPSMKIDPVIGYNGDDSTDFPMVAVHDTAEGTVGFSITNGGRLSVLQNANQVDIPGGPTKWLTVWLTATERAGTPEGRYDLKVYIDGSLTPALELANAQAQLSEITGSVDDWISIGSGHTAEDTAFQIDYVAYKSGAWEPGALVRCPTALNWALNRAIGKESLTLSWAAPGGVVYDGFDVMRDGVFIATGLPGTATTYTDLAPQGGRHTYELVAKQGEARCSITCEEQMCLWDLACSFRPGTAAGSVDCVLAWNNPGGIDSISLRRRLQHLNDLNEADEELGQVPGNEVQTIDRDIPAADLTRITYTLTATSGSSTCVVQCRPNTCPHGATCALDQSGARPAVLVSWQADRPFEGITVGRRTDAAQPFEVKASFTGAPLPTEFRDTDVSELTYYEYQIQAVQAAAEVSEPCPATGCRVFVLPAESPYKLPQDGWAYIYDAEAAGSDAYIAVAGQAGNLDGRWIRSTVEDFWDGSRPGDTGAPGGIGVFKLTSADPCKKEDRQVLLLEDTGDPRLFGYPDPSNRKLLLGLDLGNQDKNLLRSGVTFSFRMRLSPVPVEIPVEPGNAAWDGDVLAKGLGMVGIYFRNPGTPEAQNLGASAGFAVAIDESSAQVSFNPALTFPGIHPEEFHTAWVTIKGNADAASAFDIDIYLNGSMNPIAATGVALQAPEPGVLNNDPGFGASVTNFLALGLPNTAADASVEIDYIAWKEGIHVPVVDRCGGGQVEVFVRGDTDVSGSVTITDVIQLLGFMFLGNPLWLDCFDAADANDSGELEVTDAIVSLGFQFLGNPKELPLPGGSKCGLDDQVDQWPPCDFNLANCP